ncbi:MAG: hypothetical protein RLZ73_206 [Bacteroidota bacterium]
MLKKSATWQMDYMLNCVQLRSILCFVAFANYQETDNLTFGLGLSIYYL